MFLILAQPPSSSDVVLLPRAPLPAPLQMTGLIFAERLMETEQEAGWFLRGFAQEMRFCPGRGAGRITESKARSRRPGVGSLWATALCVPWSFCVHLCTFCANYQGYPAALKKVTGASGPQAESRWVGKLAEGPISMGQDILELESGEDLVTVSPNASPETPSIKATSSTVKTADLGQRDSAAGRAPSFTG